MSPLYFLIFCAPLAAVAQPRAATDKCPAIAPLLIAGVAIACVAGLLLLSLMTYCCCRRSSSPAKSRREAPPSPQMSNPVVEKASRRDPDEQLEFQGGELR